MSFKPMGAATVDDLAAQVVFPVYAAPKYDGIRCSFRNGVAFSKKMKPLPNIWLQQQAATGEYDGLDVEVVVGIPNAVDVWNKSNSFSMSKHKLPQDFPGDRVRFYTFDDHTDPEATRKERVAAAKKRCANLQFCEIVPYKVFKDALQVMQYEEQQVALGYEGIMLSSPNVSYKFGKSTVNEQGLMKFKRFVDSEARITGFVEEQRNTNEATTNELGGTKRSSAKAGKVGKGVLGVLVGTDIETGVTVNCGTGFSAAQRAEFWADRKKLLGKAFTYKHQLTAVAGGNVRFGSFKGLRDEVEL